MIALNACMYARGWTEESAGQQVRMDAGLNARMLVSSWGALGRRPQAAKNMGQHNSVRQRAPPDQRPPLSQKKKKTPRTPRTRTRTMISPPCPPRWPARSAAPAPAWRAPGWAQLPQRAACGPPSGLGRPSPGRSPPLGSRSVRECILPTSRRKLLYWRPRGSTLPAEALQAGARMLPGAPAREPPGAHHNWAQRHHSLDMPGHAVSRPSGQRKPTPLSQLAWNPKTD